MGGNASGGSSGNASGGGMGGYASGTIGEIVGGIGNGLETGGCACSCGNRCRALDGLGTASGTFSADADFVVGCKNGMGDLDLDLQRSFFAGVGGSLEAATAALIPIALHPDQCGAESMTGFLPTDWPWPVRLIGHGQGYAMRSLKPLLSTPNVYGAIKSMSAP